MQNINEFRWNFATFYHSEGLFEHILQILHDSAFPRIMNSEDILLFAIFIENLSFLVNSVSCKIKVESYMSDHRGRAWVHVAILY